MAKRPPAGMPFFYAIIAGSIGWGLGVYQGKSNVADDHNRVLVSSEVSDECRDQINNAERGRDEIEDNRHGAYKGYSRW